MISRLFVDNYKCFVNFEIRLDRLALLVGRNGAGKSSVLNVVFALRQLLRGEAKILDSAVFPTRTLTRWQKRTLQVFEMEATLDGDLFTYRLEIEHEPSMRKARVALERLTVGGGPLFSFEQGRVRLFRDDHSQGPEFQSDWSESALARVAPTQDNTRLTCFLEFARSILICNLSPAGFLTESTSEDALLDRDGRNFAAWYRHVTQEHPEFFHAYFAELASVVEGFRSTRLEKTGQDSRSLVVTFVDEGEPFDLRFDELSDGQKALIALYALTHLGGQGTILLLDEPDNFVALPEIQPWLQALRDACDEGLGQAVLCSHHPELIDYLGPEHGLSLSRESSGVIRVERLESEALRGPLKLSELVARGWER